MTETKIDLHFADALGRDHVMRAVLDGSGWRVRASLNGCAFTKHCGSWQAVERLVVLLRHRAGRPPAREASLPRRLAAAAVFVIAALAATSASAQPPISPTAAVQAFESATYDYVQMHRRLERQIGEIHLNITVAELNRIIQELNAAIRAARPEAKQGDLFTPEIGSELRARIDRALTSNGFTADSVRENERRHALGDARHSVLRVNGTFPWALATEMFPCVIAALPPLPTELQYRIVADNLILVDVHASLIVDILPNALTDLTVLDVR